MDDLFYKPGDDTFTFIKVLEELKDDLKHHRTFIEIGCGNGMITKFLCDTFPHALIISTDINICALQETGKYNSNLIKSPLLKYINQRKVDVVVFNPPYVETSNDEVGFDDIRASYSGGGNGRRVIDQFIDELSDVKIVFLLVIRKNDPKEVMERFRGKLYVPEIIKIRRIMAETIYIIRAVLGSENV